MVLFGNIVALIGCIVMVAIGFIKKKDQILKAQCAQFALMGMGNLILGATAGFISNSIGILRNLVFLRMEPKPWMKVGFIVVQGILTMITGGTALIEWLPLIAVVVYTWCLDMKSPIGFKCVLIFGQSLWLAYDWYYLNYSAFFFDILTILSTLYGMWMIYRESKKR